jgi:hypothetical protein
MRRNVVRGQVAATMVHAMVERFARARDARQAPILIYLGDLDPPNVQIPRALRRGMEEHHGIPVTVIRSALRPEQVAEYALPESVDAAKRTDPNHAKWIAEWGDIPPVELDALPPRDLLDLAKVSLESVIDMSDFAEQMEIEERERAQIKAMRHSLMTFCRNEWPGLF